jgi:hypothetical protein
VQGPIMASKEAIRLWANSAGLRAVGAAGRPPHFRDPLSAPGPLGRVTDHPPLPWTGLGSDGASGSESRVRPYAEGSKAILASLSIGEDSGTPEGPAPVRPRRNGSSGLKERETSDV